MVDRLAADPISAHRNHVDVGALDAEETVRSTASTEPNLRCGPPASMVARSTTVVLQARATSSARISTSTGTPAGRCAPRGVGHLHFCEKGRGGCDPARQSEVRREGRIARQPSERNLRAALPCRRRESALGSSARLALAWVPAHRRARKPACRRAARPAWSPWADVRRPWEGQRVDDSAACRPDERAGASVISSCRRGGLAPPPAWRVPGSVARCGCH